MSRDTWDPGGGDGLPVPYAAALCRRLLEQGADGITLSGGEPLDQAPGLAALLAALGRRPETDVLVYTGYELAEARLVGDELLSHADALITGRYDATRPTRLIWRGSAGQSLLPLTELGRRRYSAYVAHEVAEAPLEMFADREALFVVGVPQQGDLRSLDTGLTAHGIGARTVSWRPAPRPSHFRHEMRHDVRTGE